MGIEPLNSMNYIKSNLDNDQLLLFKTSISLVKSAVMGIKPFNSSKFVNNTLLE